MLRMGWGEENATELPLSVCLSGVHDTVSANGGPYMETNKEIMRFFLPLVLGFRYKK